MEIANRFVIFICLCIGSSCSFYNEPLTIARQNFTGTDFRIDGVQQDWGVFTLSDAQLTIEGWDYAMGQPFVTGTIKRYTCEILNDTTIRVKTIYHSNTEKTETLNEIRRFRQYSNKPDSTNKFISRSKLEPLTN
jgi:hypothetical protein